MLTALFVDFGLLVDASKRYLRKYILPCQALLIVWKKSCGIWSDLLVERVFVFEISSLENDDNKCSQLLRHVECRV